MLIVYTVQCWPYIGGVLEAVPGLFITSLSLSLEDSLSTSSSCLYVDRSLELLLTCFYYISLCRASEQS